MNTTTTNRYPPVLFVALLAAAVGAGFAPAAVAGGADDVGACISAEVPEGVVLPDGRLSPAGRVRICLTRRYSPVAGLHETRIDGRTVGLFASDRRISEGVVANDGEAFLVLRRLGEGRLALYAYAVRAGDRMVTYRLRDARPHRTFGRQPASTPSVADLLAVRPTEEFTVVAAAR